jgi:tetratricopeptide (TPR) repeat protein
MRDRVTIYPMFSFKVHELTKGPYKNRLIVVVVHDTAMLDIYAAEDYPAVCFLHWQNLHYLESLRDDVDFGDDMEASQRAWLLDAVTKSASLSRKRSIYETRAGNRKAAIEWAERAVGMDAENTNGYLLLARAYIADGQLGQAARTAAQALDCEANATSLLCKSEVEFRLGNHVAAVEWINRSIGKDPGNAYSYHHLAGLHELLGDQPAARAAAAKAVKLAPGNQAFAKRLASLTAG